MDPSILQKLQDSITKSTGGNTKLDPETEAHLQMLIKQSQMRPQGSIIPRSPNPEMAANAQIAAAVPQSAPQEPKLNGGLPEYSENQSPEEVSRLNKLMYLDQLRRQGKVGQ